MVRSGTLVFQEHRGLPVLRGPADAPSEAPRALRARRGRRETPVLRACRVFLVLWALRDVKGLQDPGVCRVQTVLRDEWERRELSEVQELLGPREKTVLQDLEETRALRESRDPKERRGRGVKSSPRLLSRP